MSVAGPLDKSLPCGASGPLGAMQSCSQLRTTLVIGPGLRGLGFFNPGSCPLSKLPCSIRSALFIAESFIAESVALRLGCFYVINSVS